jgi:hypothetical protein
MHIIITVFIIIVIIITIIIIITAAITTSTTIFISWKTEVKFIYCITATLHELFS